MAERGTLPIDERKRCAAGPAKKVRLSMRQCRGPAHIRHRHAARWRRLVGDETWLSQRADEIEKRCRHCIG